MNANSFRHLYGYHFAENRKIWDLYSKQLPSAGSTADTKYSQGTIRDQILHLIAVEEVWFSELVGRIPAEAEIPENNPAALREYWDRVEQQLQSYLAGLTDEMLFAKPIVEPEEDQDLMVWQVLLHVINHATDHRAQILRSFHDLGVNTWDQDYMFYAYENIH